MNAKFTPWSRVLLVNIACVIILSACCSGSSCPPPSPPRNLPSTHLTWLSKKANTATEADQYYRDIGAITLVNGADHRETFNDFVLRNGFNVADGDEIETTYFNEDDLRFGRNMHCRHRPAQHGIIACYVGNYGPPPFLNGANPGPNPAWPNQTQALSDAVAKHAPFATVAMEARVVSEINGAAVHESDGDCDPNIVYGGVGNFQTPCDLYHDVNTGLDIFAGDSVTITATGAIWSGIWGAATNGPDGVTGQNSNDPKFPLQGDRPFSLIGRLGPGHTYFSVGSARVITNHTASTQRLFLRTNDDTPGNGNGQFDVKITYLNRVNFFTYDGANNLVSAAALDKEGGKPTPGICMACHGGRFDKTTQPGHVHVIGASYLPFDVQTFGYAGVANFGINDQQEKFRLLNAVVVESKPNETNTNHPIVSFINSLYQTGPGGVHGAGNQAGNSVTPLGWQNHDPTYQWVAKPYCLLCHLTQDEGRDFTSYTNFNDSSALINIDACTAYSMPHAQVPFEKFWLTAVPDAPAGLGDIGITSCQAH